MSVIVLAFDGVIADTLWLRTHAFRTAALAEDYNFNETEIVTVLAARTFYECCALLVPTENETTRDLIALRAQQHYATRVAQGVDLLPTAQHTVRSAQRTGARIVLRADSHRREVESVLRQWELGLAFTLVRCADDLPRVPNATSVESSYHAIVTRLDALRVSGERRAVENSPHAVRIAQSILGVAELFV